MNKRYSDAKSSTEKLGNGSFNFVMLGNKSDLGTAVPHDRVEGWCADHGQMPHFSTSAKTGAGVEKAFLHLAETYIKHRAGLAGAGAGATNLSQPKAESASGWCSGYCP